MDIQPRATTYQVDSKEWLGSQHGVDEAETITLDVSTFDASQYTNGFIPSGCALGKITATGLYGPYNDTLSNGQETLDGFLLDAVRVPTGATKLAAPLFVHGAVKTSKLPFQSGQTGRGYVDAAGQTDVKGRIRFRTS